MQIDLKLALASRLQTLAMVSELLDGLDFPAHAAPHAVVRIVRLEHAAVDDLLAALAAQDLDGSAYAAELYLCRDGDAAIARVDVELHLPRLRVTWTTPERPATADESALMPADGPPWTSAPYPLHSEDPNA
ncbi:MAG: hypothetical protein ACYTAN_13775 [Planctomycetota bacterium]